MSAMSPVIRLLLFYPQGDMVEYAGVAYPKPEDTPTNTWSYRLDSGLASHINPWAELVQYTAPKRIYWEFYEAGALPPGIPPKAQMLALVMS